MWTAYVQRSTSDHKTIIVHAYHIPPLLFPFPAAGKGNTFKQQCLTESSKTMNILPIFTKKFTLTLI